jgi:undecaprenyl phosphate-alpha-L-ara4N flippase subunit ArnE
MVAFSVVMSVTAQLLLRRGMAAIAPTQGIALLRAAAQSGWVLGGLVVFAFGTGMWLLVLSRLELSLAYPLGSLSFVLITLLSAILLRERVPLLRWVGTMVILGGILVVARGEQPHRLQTDSHSSPEGERKGPS